MLMFSIVDSNPTKLEPDRREMQSEMAAFFDTPLGKAKKRELSFFISLVFP